MNINYVSKTLPMTDAMRSYAEKKLQRIQKFFDAPIDSTVTVTTLKSRQTVEVLVHIGGLYLKGAEKSEDFYASLDMAIDKIDRQVSRYKEKIKSRKHAEPVQGGLKMNVYDNESMDTEAPEIIITKDIDGKVMTVDEAVMQMDLLNKGFFVFKNFNGDINVVYRRDDGNIGLITP
jgi:putative sigma-54 modulation protein